LQDTESTRNFETEENIAIVNTDIDTISTAAADCVHL